MDGLEADPELPESFIKIEHAIEDLSQVIEKLDEHMVDIPQEGNRLLENVEVFTQQILCRIEKLRDTAEHDITKKQEEVLLEAGEFREECASVLDDLKLFLAETKRCHNQRARMFVLKKKCQTMRLDNLYKKSESVINTCSCFGFLIEKRILGHLDQFNSLVIEGLDMSECLHKLILRKNMISVFP